MAKKKVLLVDDVKLFLELEKTFFRREGIHILVARDGREALDITRREIPDIVFLDLHMPEMEGDECCRHIKEDPDLTNIPVVIVTSSRLDEDINRCREAGCSDIVFKPINRRNFLEAARELLQMKDRAAPRVDAKMHIYYGLKEDDMLSDWTVNLSTGGVFIECKRIFPAQTPLHVMFKLPGRVEEVRCRVKVAWVNDPDHPIQPDLPPGMGIQFQDLSLEDLRAIRIYTKRKLISPSW